MGWFTLHLCTIPIIRLIIVQKYECHEPSTLVNLLLLNMQWCKCWYSRTYAHEQLLSACYSLKCWFWGWKVLFVEQVKCSVRGDLGPACNSAGMIDRNVLGIDHLYAKPVYRNLKVFYCGVNY